MPWRRMRSLGAAEDAEPEELMETVVMRAGLAGRCRDGCAGWGSWLSARLGLFVVRSLLCRVGACLEGRMVVMWAWYGAMHDVDPYAEGLGELIEYLCAM